MVEVVALDGQVELWAAAVAHQDAVAAVLKANPGKEARPTSRRLPVGSKVEGMRYGEVRKVSP